jgi:hypothetical protein
MVGKALSETLKKSNKTALEILHETEARMQERDVRDSEAAYKVAQAYAVSGDKASALRVLRRSIENGFFPYPYLKTDPLLDSLRKDPGFTSLLTLARERHDAFRKKFF